MKKILFVVIAGLIFTTAGCGQDSGVKKVELKNLTDSASYAIGADIARTFKRQNIEINKDALIQGFAEYSDGNGSINEETVNAILTKFQQKMREEQQAKANKEAEENLKKGNEFLEKNKKEKGVKVTPSGLQYKVIKMGKGPKPKLTDKVKVNYKGTLIDGTVFDSSYDRGQPAVFPVNGVIKGWQEAIPMMPVGSKWTLYIPANLAYGERAPKQIGPNQVLIFEVELLGIEK
jgi:FKBP-type peptidyl-prolyl cis-trans isomerase